MDQSAEIVAITGEHIVLEGDTLELEELELAPDLALVDEVPTDPYNTCTTKVLHLPDWR